MRLSVRLSDNVVFLMEGEYEVMGVTSKAREIENSWDNGNIYIYKRVCVSDNASYLFNTIYILSKKFYKTTKPEKKYHY